MLPLLMWTGILVISIFVLIKSADYFTRSAETIGYFLKMPKFIVGVTILAIGTSLPELITSIIAVLKGASEIVIGNVVGSNITNIFLVLGLSIIFARKMKVSQELTSVDLPFFVGSALFLAICIMDGNFSFIEALLALGILAAYLIYTIYSEKIPDPIIKKEMKGEVEKKVTFWTILVLIISCFMIYLSSNYTIESILMLSEILKIGTETLALVFVALGTSLPELVVSIRAAMKGKGEIAVGNILGSNIFNSLAVMGIPALIGTLAVPAPILTLSLPIMLAATALYFIITMDKTLKIWEGWLLFMFYILFVGKVFGFF